MAELRKVHDGGSAPEAAVIFLHGLGGEMFSTWAVDPQSPRRSWPYWLKEELPAWAVYSLGYEASRTTWFGGHALPISERAASIYDYLQPYLKAGKVLYRLPLIFITHSLGGLIAKSILRKAFDDPNRGDCDLLAQTKGVVFIATPHAGSKAAKLADFSRIGLRPSGAVRDMLSHDAGLRDLNNWFRGNAEGHGVKSLAFYETKDTSGIRVVDATSADPAIGSIAATAIDANHIDIAKPESRKAQLYVQVVDFLRTIQKDMRGEAAPPHQPVGSTRGNGAQDSVIYQCYNRNSLPACAELHISVEPDSNQTQLTTRAILRCSRERLRSHDGWVFKLASQSLLMTLRAYGGKVSYLPGFGDGKTTDDHEIVRGPHNGFTLRPGDHAPLLKGLVLGNVLLPTVHAMSGRSCSFSIEIGAFPEDLDIAEVVRPDGTRTNDLAVIREDLLKIVVSRGLKRQPIEHERFDRVDDQIVLSGAHVLEALSEGSTGNDSPDGLAKDRIDWNAVDRIMAHPNDDFVELVEIAGLDPATDFVRTDLRFIDFGRCDLTGFNFEGSNLEGADLSRANIKRTGLKGIKGSATWHADAEAAEEQTIYQCKSQSTFLSVFPSTQLYLAEDPAPLQHDEPSSSVQQSISSLDRLPIPPAGWTWIDKAWIDAGDKHLDDDELGRFFDGVLPQWRHALSDRIPRRDVVGEVAALLKGASVEPKRPCTIFLQGAGGEGKSMAFRQTVAQLVADDPRWLILWRENDFERMILKKEFVDSLPQDGRPILIATDEAHNIARSLLAFVEEARARDVGGLHVLIAARDTDWQAADPQQKRWEEVTDFQTKRLRGVSEADAGRIIDAWSRAGKLGELAGLHRDEAVRRFVQVSHDEQMKFGEGALLGAMIELRMAEGFRPYVRSLLRRLDGIGAPGGSLGRAYSYIAAMHAENLRFLSNPVLAHLLGCDGTTLRKEVIRPLASEAAGHSQGDFILTRHRRIAEMAMAILEEDESEDRFCFITELSENVIRSLVQGIYIPEMAGWNYEIGKHLIKRGRAAQAIALARRYYKLAPGNIHYLVNLASTLRETGNATAAVDVFRQAPETIARDRVFYYEWGTAAGNAGDRALDVWLAGVSLSDADGLPRLDAQRVKLSLAGLGVACKELYENGGDRAFLHARAAAGQLGLRIPGIEPDAKTSGYFRRYRDEASAEGIGAMSVEAAVQAIEESVLGAFDLSDAAEDLADEGVPYRDEISFKSLRDFPWRQE